MRELECFAGISSPAALVGQGAVDDNRGCFRDSDRSDATLVRLAGFHFRVLLARCRGLGDEWGRPRASARERGDGRYLWRYQPSHRQSSQPDAERCGAVGYHWRYLALRDMACAFAAVRGEGLVAW